MATPPPYKRGRLDLKDLPPGRFLYTTNGSGAICEGRVLERCDDDPEKEGEWLKLDESGVWHWSGDIWIECRLPDAGKYPLTQAALARDSKAAADVQTPGPAPAKKK